MSELEFPSIVAPAEPPVAQPSSVPATVSDKSALAKLDLTTVALAHFGDWQPAAKALKARFANIAWDVSNTKGLEDAKRARLEARQPRYDAQNTSKALKSVLAKVSKAVGQEEEAIAAAFEAIEQPIDKVIKDREAAIEAEKQREQERKAKHAASIATIRGYATQARERDLSAERLAAGIEYVQGINVSAEAFEEFADEASQAKDETLNTLGGLHANAVEAERVRAENERRKRVIDAIAQIQQQLSDCVGKPSADIALQLSVMEQTVYNAELGTEVVAAHNGALLQLRSLFRDAVDREDMQRELAAARAAVTAPTPPEPNAPAEEGNVPSPAAAGAYASSEAEAAEVSPSGETGKAAHAEQRAAEPTIEQRPVELAGAVPVTPDQFTASVVQAICPNYRPIDALPMNGAASPIDMELLLGEALELVRHAASAFDGKFPTQPKPSVEWWGQLRTQSARLRPVLEQALAEVCL